MRKIIFVIGLLIMPCFWFIINLLIFLDGDRSEKFVTLTFLYKDYWKHFKSGKSFGAFD